jgi:hypothetical protein
VTYLVDGQDVTSAVTAGDYRTQGLVPGEAVSVFVKVTRTRASGPGDRRRFEVRAGSVHAWDVRDTVASVVWVAGGTLRTRA